MEMTATADLPAPTSEVFDLIDDLATYPDWLRLVHSAVPSAHPGDEDQPAWDVELRAKVGLFARSKKLRMVRTRCDYPTSVAFDRGEVDGRDHAEWALRAEVAAHPNDPDATKLTMHLIYSGSLWLGGGLLQSVLDDEVQRGRRRLIELLQEHRR